jgi:hypothetical protein
MSTWSNLDYTSGLTPVFPLSPTLTHTDSSGLVRFTHFLPPDAAEQVVSVIRPAADRGGQRVGVDHDLALVDAVSPF